MTMSLQKDLKFKDDELNELQDINISQMAMINQLNNELNSNKATIQNLQLRAQQTPKKTKVDFGEIERADKATRDNEELELLLQTRTDEFELAMSDLNVVEQTCNMLESEKMQLLEELETARELFDQREQEFIEQSQMLNQLSMQMAEI